VAVCDPERLEPLDTIANRSVALLAVRFGPVRLIDNMILKV
jgi:pantothenate synthetase